MWRRRRLHRPAFLGLAGASSVGAPFLELGTRGLSHSVGGAVPRRRPRPGSSDPIFLQRKVREDVAGGTAVEESWDLDDDLVPGRKSCCGGMNPREGSAESIAICSLEVCSNQTLTLRTRSQAIRTISRLAERTPDSLRNFGLVERIMQAMFQLLAESPLSVAASARGVITTMALNLPGRVFSPVIDFALISSLNTNPKYREAAFMALGAIAEGCSKKLKGELETSLDIVLVAHQDADPMVRAAASYALLRFAEHLQPDILSQRRIVLHCILNAHVGADHEMIKSRSKGGEGEWLKVSRMRQWHPYDSLVALCDNMTGEEILPFLDPIMSKLLSEFQCASYDLQKRSMDAICSVAAAAGQGFLPYAERVTCEGCWESNFSAVSETADSWNQFFGSFRRRDTYGYFCSAAEILGDGFAKYLPGVVPLAISSCNHGDDSATAQGNAAFTGDILEKAAATQALGLFAVHTKSAFAPYLGESMSIMIKHSAHNHGDVRLQGVIGLKNILTAAQAVFESHSDGAAKANEVMGTVMNIYTKAMVEDRDRGVVARVCTNTVDILKDFEYAAWEPYMPQIFDSASQLREEKSACQRQHGHGSEHDEAIMAAVTELLRALAGAKGSSTTWTTADAKSLSTRVLLQFLPTLMYDASSRHSCSLVGAS